MLCFDIETTGLDPHKNKVTVICVEDFITGFRRSFEFARYPDDSDKLTLEIVRLFEEAKSLCAFNGVRFDIPFMIKSLKIDEKYKCKWIAKTSDILEQSRLRFKTTFSLNLLCQTNDIPIKISDGREAIRMAQDQRWSQLNEYCAKDVSILCDIYRKQFIIHPRSKLKYDLKYWVRDGLYEEEPIFFHFCRERFSWSPQLCSVVQQRMALARQCRTTDVSENEMILNLMDCRWDEESNAYKYTHNKISTIYGNYKEAMNVMQLLENDSDAEDMIVETS